MVVKSKTFFLYYLSTEVKIIENMGCEGVKKYAYNMFLLFTLVALLLSPLVLTIYNVPRLKEGASWTYIWEWKEVRIIDGKKHTISWKVTYKIKIRGIESDLISYTLLSAERMFNDVVNQSSSFVRCYARIYDADKNGKYDFWLAFIESPFFIKLNWSDLKNEWKESVDVLKKVRGIEIRREEAENWMFTITISIKNVENDVNYDYEIEEGNVTIKETVKYSREGILISLKYREIAKFEGGDSYTITANFYRSIPYFSMEFVTYAMFGICIIIAGISGYIMGTKRRKQLVVAEGPFYFNYGET